MLHKPFRSSEERLLVGVGLLELAPHRPGFGRQPDDLATSWREEESRLGAAINIRIGRFGVDFFFMFV